MKKLIVTIIITFFSISIFAQNQNDALRYSLVNYGGTARFMGLSGAYGAIGADFSTLSQNPAGIGLYRKSEFTITPMLASSNINSSYLGQSNADFRNMLYLGNVGFVMAINTNSGNENQLKQVQFGFGVNRMATFGNRMEIGGYNNESSLLTPYMLEINEEGLRPAELDPFGANLAYEVYLINYDSITGKSFIDMPYGGVQQLKTITTKGSTSETVLSAGGNFGDKLFLGVTFAFPEIKYEEESVYTEEDINNLNDNFDSFKRSEYLKTTGSGFNFKFGFIYKPFDFMRIGGAFHTPTSYYKMTDKWNASMTALYDLGDSYSMDSPEGTYDYRLTTPMRAIGSIAFVIGHYGLISADYEFVDYSTARLRADDYNFSEENTSLNKNLIQAGNLRVGAEWKAGIYAFRGGLNIYGSPFKGENNFLINKYFFRKVADGSFFELKNTLGARTGYSFGFGVHDKGYFLDFSFNHNEMKDNYYLYNIASASENKYNNNSYSITLGFRL